MSRTDFAHAVCTILTFGALAVCQAQTFTLHSKRIKVGPNVTAVIAIDLDGDGLPEIVTADRGRMADPREERPAQDQLSYLVAKGNLAYEAQPQLRTGFAPYAIVAADIDLSGSPDLIVANFLDTRGRDITLFRNIGNHLFEPVHFAASSRHLRYSRMRDGDNQPVFTVPGLTSLVAADFNRDGRRDLVVTGWSSDILLYFPGQAERYFGDPRVFDIPGGPRDVKTADFDGDGHLDLAIILYSSNEIALWRGDGRGDFGEATRFPSRGRLPNKIEIADVNSDGKRDLVVSHCHADDSIVIFYGDGGFEFPMSREIQLGTKRGAIEFEIRDLIADDLDGDGKTDLAAACYAANAVIVLINTSRDDRPPQNFRKETYAFTDGKPRALCRGDLNQDDKADLIVALWEENTIAFLLGK